MSWKDVPAGGESAAKWRCEACGVEWVGQPTALAEKACEKTGSGHHWVRLELDSLKRKAGRR